MLKFPILAVAGSLVLMFFTEQAREAVRPEIDDPEAYAVYASLIAEEWTVRVAHATRLVVLRETATYNQCLPSGGPLEKDWRSVVDNFKKQNAAVPFVQPDRDLSPPYVVVP